jgi:molybdopterin-binding protein
VIILKISARNCFTGKVESVEEGQITAKVKVKIESPGIITAIISKESVEDLEIKVGDEVIAVIKSTEVMVAKE